MNYLFIGLGGVLGAISRHYIFTQFENKITNFPYHTLIVNIIGCALIGILAEIFALKSSLPYQAKLFLITGFLGSFTTFSTFALDNVFLIEKNEMIKSLIYTSGSVLSGIIVCFAAAYGTRFFLIDKA